MGIHGTLRRGQRGRYPRSQRWSSHGARDPRWTHETGAYFAGGGSLFLETSCDVDITGGPGFLGGETLACADFTDIPLESNSLVPIVLLSAGVQRVKWGLEARVDQGISAAMSAPSGDLTPRRITLLLNYRFNQRP